MRYAFEFFFSTCSAPTPKDFLVHTAGKHHVGLSKALDGQPVKTMMTLQSDNLLQTAIWWSFLKLWHSALYPDALAAAAAAAAALENE